MDQIRPTACRHAPLQWASPRAEACEGCGSRASLRLCTECGHVGCCESQSGHARAHALVEGHAVIGQLPLSERSFTWCYSCGAYL